MDALAAEEKYEEAEAMNSEYDTKEEELQQLAAELECGGLTEQDDIEEKAAEE